MSIVLNEDIKILIAVEKLLHEELKKGNYEPDDPRWETWNSYWNIVDRYIEKKKERAKIQRVWNKNNKEYHRITNNISSNKVRGNKEKEEYWRNKLKEYRSNRIIKKI